MSSNGARWTGTVLRFGAAFGFIKSGAMEVFVHVHSCPNALPLVEGTTVEFTPADDKQGRGKFARNVTVIK